MGVNRATGGRCARMRAYVAADPAYDRMLAAAGPIPRERERDLFGARGTAAWPSACDEIVRSQMRLAVNLAGRFFRALDPDDAIATAFHGLVMAAERHDPARGTVYATTATFYVRRELGRAVVDRGTIHVPHRLFWAASAGAPAPGVDEGCLAAAVSALHGWDRGATPEVEARGRPEEAAEEADDRARLAELVATLPDRHREAISLRFGLGDGRPVSVGRIAKALRMKTSRVLPVCDEALEMLRAAFGAEAGAAKRDGPPTPEGRRPGGLSDGPATDVPGADRRRLDPSSLTPSGGACGGTTAWIPRDCRSGAPAT